MKNYTKLFGAFAVVAMMAGTSLSTAKAANNISNADIQITETSEMATLASEKEWTFVTSEYVYTGTESVSN